jgi:hypothetical protein
VDWYRKPRPISSRYLSQVERITMASRSARSPGVWVEVRRASAARSGATRIPSTAATSGEF